MGRSIIKKYQTIWPWLAVIPVAWLFGHMVQVQWIDERCRSPEMLSTNARLCADNVLRLTWGGWLMVVIFLILFTLIQLPFRINFFDQIQGIRSKITLAFQAFALSVLCLSPVFLNERFLFLIGFLFFSTLSFLLRREIMALFDTVPGSGQIKRDKDTWLLGLMVFAFFFHAVFGFVGLLNPIADHHSWRQTQTANSIFYMVQEGFKVDYITPIFGKPWSIPLEFPLYQYSVAALTKFSRANLELVSRLVSMASFYIFLWFIYLLLRMMQIPVISIRLAIVFVLLSPLYVFFSRAVFIDMFTVMLGAIWLYTTAAYFFHKKMRWLLIAMLAGCLLALSKFTTFVVFCFFIFGIFWFNRQKPFLENFSTRNFTKLLYHGLFIGLIPALAGLFWVYHADQVKSQNPIIGDLWSSAALRSWNFGTLEQRLSLAFWEKILVSHMRDVAGHMGILIFSVSVFFITRAWHRPENYWPAVGILAFAAGPLIFANLYFVHDYYFIACAVFFLVVLALQIGRHYEIGSRTVVRNIRYLIILPVIISMVSWYFDKYLPKQMEKENHEEKIGRAIRSLTRPSDILIIHGSGARPNIPYYAERKTLINQSDFKDYDGIKMQRALALLQDENIGAVALSTDLTGDEKKNLMQKYAKRYGFKTLPAAIVAGVEIYTKL